MHFFLGCSYFFIVFRAYFFSAVDPNPGEKKFQTIIERSQ
jgi:hypothetical protein